MEITKSQQTEYGKYTPAEVSIFYWTEIISKGGLLFVMHLKPCASKLEH